MIQEATVSPWRVCVSMAPKNVNRGEYPEWFLKYLEWAQQANHVSSELEIGLRQL